MLTFSLVGICLSGMVVMSSAIPYYEVFQDGPCQTNKDVNFMPVQNIRKQMLYGLSHISAGSKYTLYRLASHNPQSILLNEDELLQNFCPTRNASIGNPIEAHFGFGLPLQTYFTKSRVDLPNVYVDLTPTDADEAFAPHRDTLRQYITSTDDKNFAVVYNCWTGTNKRGWMVISRTPKLDVWTRGTVESHVKSLGFKTKNTVFLNGDHCPTVKSPFSRGNYMDVIIPPRNHPIRKEPSRLTSNEGRIFADYLATTTRSTDVPVENVPFEPNNEDHSLNLGGSLTHDGAWQWLSRI